MIRNIRINEDTLKSYGDYNYIHPSVIPSSQLSLQITPVDLMLYWERCSLISDFIASFYSTNNQDENSESMKKKRNQVSTILNEIVENAAKFSTVKGKKISIWISSLNEKLLIFKITNEIDEQSCKKLNKKLDLLFSGRDLEEIYVEHLEEREAIGEEENSGLGLLMLLKDHPIKLGIGIASLNERHSFITEVQAYIFGEEN